MLSYKIILLLAGSRYW